MVMVSEGERGTSQPILSNVVVASNLAMQGINININIDQNNSAYQGDNFDTASIL